MKIVFSKHALVDKFKLLKKHRFYLKQKDITAVVKNPEHTDKKSDYPKIIVSKNYSNKHVIRVVYKIERDIIKIITFYPAEKGRYY